MSISQKTIDFLIENRLMDSRVFFNENHDTYSQVVRKPVTELVEQLSQSVRIIDPLIVTHPSKVISHINRDTRFTKDKSLYRDVVWLLFRRSRQIAEHAPCFYFEFSPRHWEYGCGFYTAGTGLMEILRQMILEDHKDYKAAQRAYGKQEGFVMAGEKYKRPRYGDQPPKKQEWLERRNIYFTRQMDDYDLLYSDKLADVLAEGFKSLAPIYRLFCSACEREIICS